MGRSSDIEAFLAAMDPALVVHGLKRRRKAQEWLRNTDELNRDSVHINFGLVVVNPSVSVQYRDLAAAVPSEFHSCHASAMLQSLVPRSPDYDFGTSAAELAADIVEFGLPYLGRLHDRDFVIQSLYSTSPADWCVFSYSDRIRLLPLLLASGGRAGEAMKFIDQAATEAEDRDQLIPRYIEFVTWFRVWVAGHAQTPSGSRPERR